MELDSGGGGKLSGRDERRKNKVKCNWRRGAAAGGSVGVLVTFLVFLSCFHLGASLKCYHCLEKPKSTEKHLACAYFDMTERFHKECTHSSMCMKRTSQFQLHNGSYVTIHVHKCADQSHKTMFQDENGDWKWAQLFRRDLYNEGCFPHNTPSMLTTNSYHCFCSTDFCNGAPAISHDKTFFTSWLTFIALMANLYLNRLI